MSDSLDHRDLAYMRQALDLARNSPPRPSNFRVGAVLVDEATNTVLSEGYTLELPGNTHAEQCCLMKLAEKHGVEEEGLPRLSEAALPRQLGLYTTMEPCSFRMSGNLPCVQRVLRLASATPETTTPRQITVYSGVTEPDTFVSKNTGRQTLEGAGIRFVHVAGLEDEILTVATAGHETKSGKSEEMK
ncbi:DRAP deaminase [Sporothrix brasiliensis 5110]|uniref:DRAP deaminase n=1 Tax=Sporothrix brasiliensis 5110 TaxID=1398154 RepID=A0A0C2IQA2_9PEZI|nr:DRAP deaminase [Sporothrix brasiliensis 5110]KIH87237.1 DRAP deaminase [Sporothrix brasiliensis 5110]